MVVADEAEEVGRVPVASALQVSLRIWNFSTLPELICFLDSVFTKSSRMPLPEL